jgi:serine/threonine-protein kinase HipA
VIDPTTLERITTIQVADVHKAGSRAAQLRRTPTGVEFHYLPEHLDGGGPPVATTLPLTDRPRLTPAGAVPPFFAGLLPEGRRLSSLRRLVKTSADDELSLLLAVGRDPVGDVQVVPEGEDPIPAEPLVQVSADWSEVRFADVLADAGVVDPVALPGVQDKASARMISVPVGRAGIRWLLKVDPPEYPHVVENEAFFLDWARRARVPAAEAVVVQDAEGRAGLLVQRFDRVPTPTGAAVALPCEDACQVLDRWPADKYNVTAEEVASGLAAVCGAPLVALSAVFRQLCFAWLTGNGDVHAKNVSVLADGSGEWHVSPAYDLPSTVVYGDRSLALPMGGRRTGLSRRHLFAFAVSVGLPERAAARALDDVLARTEGLEASLRAGALPFPRHVVDDLVAELRYRRRHAMDSG